MEVTSESGQCHSWSQNTQTHLSTSLLRGTFSRAWQSFELASGEVQTSILHISAFQRGLLKSLQYKDLSKSYLKQELWISQP